MHNNIIAAGPYTPTIVTTPAVPATKDSPAVPEQTTVETVMNMTPENRAHFESVKKAIHLILTGIGVEIYSIVDAYVKTNLFWEFGQFTSHDGETIESYYTRFYKMMNEMIRNNLTVATMQVNVQFLQQLQPEWSRFVTIVKQQHKLDEVSYHKLFDILKQYQKEVNELRAERMAKNANPLALVATAQTLQDPYYQTSKPHKSYAPTSKASLPTRSHATTRYKGKEIAKPITPPSESASKEDSDPEQAQRDKDMQNFLALIAKYFKKIYKPTNNNLRTSSNTRNKNVDTTPRYKNDNQTGQFGNQRAVNVTRARETVGGLVVEQSGIQCFNCKEFEQSDWLADTDEEIDEQELEAHYSYMAKIQEVPNADLGTDGEPLEQVQYDTDDNVFANDIQHFEQSESISNTCAVETGDSNVIPDSPDMCDNDIQNDQHDVECDDERVALANLIANLKLDVDDNKKIQKQLKKANATLTQELTECKSILAETSRTLGESNSIRDSCLVALQNKQTEFERYKAFNDRTVDYDKLERKLNETLGLLAQKDIDIQEGLKVKAYEISVVQAKHDELVKQSLLTRSHYEGLVKEKTKVITDLKLREEKDIDKMISMDHQIKFLNEIVYKRNQSIQTIQMLAPKCSTFNGRPTFANPMYHKKAQYDPATRLILDIEEILTLADESRSKLNKDLVKPFDYTKMWSKEDMVFIFANFILILDDITELQCLYLHKVMNIVQIILFIVDSGCTKHMTGNVSLLCNFVDKYLGTVRFGNDQFAPILGYGDLIQGNITIKRVYYVRRFDEFKEMSETSVANVTSGLAKYTLEILKKHGMEKGQSIGTPMATKPKLDADLSGEPVDQTDYRSKIGSLMYLTSSRPDIRTQLQDYGFTYNKIPLYCDSQSAIAISCNPVQHSRTKHIHTRYHFIKEQVENGIIELYFVRTEYQLADMFTKALPEERSYALSWKPCQGDSLNLPDHRIHKDGDGDASFQLKSDSLPHAQSFKTTKTFYKHQDSRIMKAQELKTKTSAQTLILKITPQKSSFGGDC
ncbi:retrovirus-related pol polyprotein from transposon TNT 1-94 [Tanacetum coccineum]